jgi:MoxR-like ATPase
MASDGSEAASTSAGLDRQLARVQQVHADFQREVRKVIHGNDEALTLAFLSLLSGGHTLLLGLPGLGKTKLATTVARALALDFCRIQFTPDLMPADITGTDMIEEDVETGRRRRTFLRGPVFTNVLLADEINRTPPKTQAALLQAMQEHEVSVGRTTYPIGEPFLVLATQNPLELEGTYVLPEAQLDRFMFCARLHYPDARTEANIVKGTTAGEEPEVAPVVKSGQEVLALRRLVRAVPVADEVVDLAVALVRETRPETSTLEEVRKYASYGGSPRATQSLIVGAKARALCAGRAHVTRQDVYDLVLPVLRHRLVLNFRARANGVDSDLVIRKLIK